MMIDKTKKTGGLYQLNPLIELNKHFSPRFCFIQGDKINIKSLWDERYLISEKEDILILVKPDMNLSTETFDLSKLREDEIRAYAIDASTSLIATKASPLSINWRKDHDNKRKQWDEYKCIPGLVFLTPNGSLIWMSDVDFKYFKEVDL